MAIRIMTNLLSMSLLLVPQSSGAIKLRGRLSSYLEQKLPQQIDLKKISKLAVPSVPTSVILPESTPLLIIAL